jgi:hypothetical protein
LSHETKLYTHSTSKGENKMKRTNQEASVYAKAKSQAKTSSHVNVEVETTRGTMAAMAAVPTLIGLWAAACFISAMIASGGPFGLVKNWFSAVGGF